MPAMLKRIALLTGLLTLGALTAAAQPNINSVAMDVANMREDIRLLTQRVGELSLAVEQLNRENSILRAHDNMNYVTMSQLNEAVADMNKSLSSGLTAQKRDILQQVAAQMEKLGKSTQAALDALAKGQATRPPVQTEFKDNFPKQGVNYTVQSGDTLSGIAQKHTSSVQDIINANKIADPTKLQVGQTLFIPQAK